MKYLKNEEAAKDAVQHVYAKAIVELQKYNVEFIKSWLYMIARNSFARNVSDIRNSSVNTLEKLNLYRTALISYMGLCEAPALLAFVFFLLTNNYLLLLIGAIMLLAMAIKFPSRERLIADMSLDGKEQQELV